MSAQFHPNDTDAPSDLIGRQFMTLSIFVLLEYAVQFVLCVGLTVYTQHNRNEALRGDGRAARRILLPALEPLLWIISVIAGGLTAYMAYLVAGKTYLTLSPSVANEILYSGRHFGLLFVAVFMLQKNVSLSALARAAMISLFTSAYTVPLAWAVLAYSDSSTVGRSFWIISFAHAPTLIPFMYVAIYPPSRANKRIQRQCCAYYFVAFTLESFSYFTLNSHALDVRLGFIYAGLVWGSLSPLVIWRVLKADTAHWRGFGQRVCQLQPFFQQRASVDEQISSQGLHILIEMHCKYIIDFAYLRLNKRIGVGSSAVVYGGMLHSKTAVAVKAYTPSMITDDMVARFSSEAALCGALTHPNIVKFYGMCVSPPAICLVSELCQGSLDVVTATIAKRSYEPRRQQFLINIGHMVDAARAIAHLHSFSPPLLHRNIKPANFLVDTQGNVKLADFGESRRLTPARCNTLVRGDDCASLSIKGADHQSDSSPCFDGQLFCDLERATETFSGSTISLHHSHGPRATSSRPAVTGTVDHMAPEIIMGVGRLTDYDSAADIYALGITMWEILYPGEEKYPEAHNNTFLIFDTVVSGCRPHLNPRLHPKLQELLTNCWHSDPALRPSAQQIVHILEQIQEETAAIFALELIDELQEEMVLDKLADEFVVRSVTGDAITKTMSATKAVGWTGEDVRLGNLLMNAGFLHHVKHTQRFKAKDTRYYFDEYAIALTQPLAMLEGSTLLDGSECGTRESLELSPPTMMAQPSCANNMPRSMENVETGDASQEQATRAGECRSASQQSMELCACRQLGQRLPVSKSPPMQSSRKRPEFTQFGESRLAALFLSRRSDNEDDAHDLSISPVFVTDEVRLPFSFYVH